MFFKPVEKQTVISICVQLIEPNCLGAILKVTVPFGKINDVDSIWISWETDAALVRARGFYVTLAINRAIKSNS